MIIKSVELKNFRNYEPIERHIFAHEFKVSHERDCADKQKQGDKHRR